MYLLVQFSSYMTTVRNSLLLVDLRHGPFDILGGGGAGIFWKKISLL